MNPFPRPCPAPVGRPAWRALSLAWSLALLLLASLAGGCRSEAAAPHDDHDETPPPTNRIDVPPPVRENLGIRFVTVERRRVAATLRLPGHFELLPAARTEYRAPVAGRVQVRVQPLQAVQAGDLLFTLEAPEWRRLQRELSDLLTEQTITKARLAAQEPLLEVHEAHELSLREAGEVMAERVQALEQTRQSLGGQAAELAAARVQLAQMRSQAAEVAEHHAEVHARLAELRAQIAALDQRYHTLLSAAATVTGIAPKPLEGIWRKLDGIEIRAQDAGVVGELGLAGGAWLETGELVASVVDLRRLRFRARCPQGDLARIQDGQAARVVATNPATPSIPGTLQLGAVGDPTQRTLEVYLLPSAVPAWARPGIAAFLEIEVQSGDEHELAIPSSCVLPDGLRRVFFRRNPKNPDQVIRIDADLGVADGRWTEIKSGLVDGDEVVLDGAYELMLASSGSAMKGGHFHADGSFHADH